jgi:hypothetical protein
MREAPCSVLVVKLPKGITVPVKSDYEVAVGPA